MSKQLMKGNHALAEAAVRAGCRFFGGYPITPQSEILEYLSARMPEVGGAFVQSENEISGVCMVYGAAAAGFRAMTSSSGPGFSLKQEGISFIAAAELPAVIIDVMRVGCGLGDIFPAQEDYFQVTKGGGHGSYRTIVYVPNSAQENADIITLAFDKAEEYRNPVIVLSDGAVGQMMEPVEFAPFREFDADADDRALKGKGDGKSRIVANTMYYNPDYDNHLREKITKIIANEQRWETVETEDAEIILVAYGITSRICKEAVEEARSQGIKVGLVRPITVFPFPVKAFDALSSTVKKVAAVEINPMGQMVEDVALALKCRMPVYSYATGQKIPDTEDVLKYIVALTNNQIKEVY